MVQVYSLDSDFRLRAQCANIKCSYKWYLAKTLGAEANLKIQRRIISGSKAYATLRSDLKKGCVLPPVVMAVDIPSLANRLPALSANFADNHDLLEEIGIALDGLHPQSVYIIDGLQRTNALRQVSEELSGAAKDEFLRRFLRAEIWLNIGFSALAYRMLLLNAGQRPMSIKHQVEILSQNLKADLQTIPKIEIMEFGGRRVRPGQFQLSKLSLAFQAWLQGNPNVDVRNTVVEQMLADSALETLSATLNSDAPHNGDDKFREFGAWLVSMDHLIGFQRLEFLGNETVLQGIAAAVGSSQRNAELRNRVELCLEKLRTEQEGQPDSDSLGIQAFDDVRKGIDPSKKNVGEATRNLVYGAFQEFFITGGMKPMTDCWNFAGARQ
jgi:hypothetical protein